ncbi:TetR/AcrR family transcriptional regulator [Anaerobium acetethylicum]|uniref:DNA-binding transcriptional regulator, AcrR family n=1 Tax=Anaerobium acetethylicum TaxID=1619234 RepID=A0A1D3TR84_9FIRM|nr:TetR/AcrR family transcriptional regulator [Anaerobium acetethylicum]SCP96208.1 DNA-binding transcriptional regulator, AcrR family [Anaerobium acetethylicum]
MNKREAILEAALTEFSSNDFENASVNNIIKEANTSKGNFYHYFSNKEELYIALLKEAMRKKAEFMNIADENDIFVFLEKQVLAGIRFSRENPEYYQLSRRFAKEKNTKIYNRVLEEITNEYNNESFNSITEMKYDRTIFSNEFPEEFIGNFIQMVLNNINELIEENDDIPKIEEKLLLIIKVLKNGLEQKL